MTHFLGFDMKVIDLFIEFFSFRRDEIGTFGERNYSIWDITCVTAESLT